MKRTTSNGYAQTLLGEILVRRGIIGREKLEAALTLQQVTGQRLGEILISQGHLCEQRLAHALRRQRNLRFAINFITAIGAPTSALADAGHAQASPYTAAMTRSVNHMLPLPDTELSQVNARGALIAASISPGNTMQWLDTLSPGNKSGDGDIARSATKSGADPIELSLNLIQKLLPFEANISVHDVVYAPDSVPMTLQQDGSIALRLPESIGALSFTDIRVRGSQDPSIGDIYLTGINFKNSSLQISRH